jgi:putative ABC transport system permease protein
MSRALRALLARPGFTIVAIATLTLGFGVNAAVFSLTRTVLLRELPYRDADRLVQVNETSASLSALTAAVSPANYVAWRERVTAFEQTAYFRRVQVNVSVPARAIQVEGFLVSTNFFRLLGIDAARGRGFHDAEASAPGRDNVVIVGDGFWRRVFDGDPSIVGRKVLVDGTPCTVIGVLPATFKIFHVLNREVDLFRPLVLDPTETIQTLNLWARLEPGVTVASADAQLKAAYPSLPFRDRDWTGTASLLSTRLAAGPKSVLVALESAVGLVLLIACANVANLLLALAAGRRTEFAVRQALGAGRWRIARDLAGETSVLVAAGCALAILLALWLVSVLNAIVSFQDINRLEPFRIDGWVLAFTVAVAAGVAFVFGLLPAGAAGTIDVAGALKESGHAVAGGASSRRVRQALIVAELALAIVLTVSAVTLTRSAIALHDLTRGVSVDGVMTAQVALNDPRYAAPELMVQTADAILDRLRRSPGVDAAALVNYLPLALIRVGARVAVEGVPPPSADRPWVARYFVISPAYFSAVGIPMIAGRNFNDEDDRTRAGVAIVSETFARRFWKTTDVVGRHITPEFGESTAFWVPRSRGGPMTVVGVVRDVSEEGILDSAGFPQMYVPYAQNPTVVSTLVAHAARGPAETLAVAIRDAVHDIDPQLPVSYEMTFDEVLRETFARPRELAWLIGSFAALALLLAAIGVYGVMAFMTTARAREIAIRMALGAAEHDVVTLIVGDAMKLAAVGVAIGVTAVPLSFRLLNATVYGVAAWNPIVVVAVAVALALVCAIASAVPAWRAARISDMPRAW